MKIAVLMDDPSRLAPKKDSTIAMIASAKQFGFECVYFTIRDLFCLDGVPYAHMFDINLLDLNEKKWCALSAVGVRALHTFDVILMRKDPPIDKNYLDALHLLSLAERQGVWVSNRPHGLRDVHEKMATLQYPSLIPTTCVSSNVSQLKDFWQQHREVIFKRLNGMGGQSVFHVGADGRNVSVILELLTENQSQCIMAQTFIPEIHTHGDKRILMIGGKPIPYALARFPAEGESRGNLAAGGRGQVVPLTAQDQKICQDIAPMLLEKGLDFVGIDVIGNYLTEINVTSPTCIREINKETNLDIAGLYLEFLKKKRQVIQ